MAWPPDLDVRAPDVTGADAGGTVTVHGGDSVNGDAGNVALQPGAASGTGADGVVTLQDPTAAVDFTYDPDNHHLDASGVLGTHKVARVTTAQRNAITDPQGCIVENTDTVQFEGHNGVSWVPLAGGTALILSVFGRVGAIVATLGDYTSSLITNLSGVAGATVTAALDTLATSINSLATTIANLGSDAISNASTVPGATVSDALETLEAAAAPTVSFLKDRLAALASVGTGGATLLTVNVTLAAGDRIAVDAALNFENTTGLSIPNRTRATLQFNGTAVNRGAQSLADGYFGSIALVEESVAGSDGLIVGVNTITITWDTNTGTSAINPATPGQGACLRVTKLAAV